MATVTILVLAILCLAEFVVGAILWHLWVGAKEDCQREQTACASLIRRLQVVEGERDELLRQKQRLTNFEQKAQDKPKVLNSAQARLRVNQMNAPFFSADKHVPNSETMKENSNG